MRLEAILRLRRLGLWPWLALLCWGFYAAGQEPRLLRNFEIHVSWQGVWSGAAVLLIALASSAGRAAISGDTGPIAVRLRSPVRTLAVVGLGLALMVGVVQATLAWTADFLTGHRTAANFALRSAAGFWIALLPASIACACLAPRWGSSMLAKLVVVTAVGFSLSLSTLCFSGLSATATTASLLAAAGAVCTSLVIAPQAAVIRTPAPHANRHSR